MTLSAQPTINISNATANNGETVDINITANNYTDYISLEFTLNWDPTILNFVSVSNLTNGLPGFTEQSSINLQQNGILNVVWFESNITPTSLPSGTTVFTISFEVTGDPCDSTGLTVPNIEIVDENEEVAATIVNPGFVRVPGSGCGVFDGVRIVGEEKTVNSGSPVCIKFTTDGFDDVIAASYTITFNPSVIQYTGIQNINWPDLVQGSTYSDAEAANGILRVVWSDPNAQSINIADGTVLYELCFTAVGSGGQMSQIGFGNNPVQIEFADGNSDPIAFQGVPGKVTIEGVIEGFALIFPDVQAQQGSEVCLPLTINDFIDIIAVQTSINWDSTVLEFERFEGFNLPGLASSVAGPEGPANNAGQAVIAWIDDNIEGVTLTNGTELLRICFNVIGECDESSTVSFTSTPTDLEIADIGGEPIPVTVVDGSVLVNCEGCGASVVNVEDICAGGEVGSIDITVSGGCAAPVTYLWSNNATTQDLNGVNAGEYVVTITVGGNQFIILDTITIRVLQPIQVSANITDAPNGNDGSISITVTGGEPGYTFVWNTNPPSTTQNVSNLAPGQYSVTITDANGCTFVAGPFTVNDDAAILATVTNVDCFGTSTGSINISAVNCVQPPLTYQWAGSPLTTPIRTNLAAGTYSVTVTGMGGATCTASFQVLQSASPISVAIDTINETSAGNNGAIDLTISGGQPPYSYQWTGPAGPRPSTEDQTGLSAGNYNVTITDQFGCEVTRTILIQGNALIINVSGSSYNGSGVSCAQECDGEVLALPVNGVGNMTFAWSNGRTTQVISGVCAGTYTVTVTDGLGRSTIASFTLVEPNELILQVEINCASEPGIADGSAFAQVSGGTQPYHFLWNTGSTESSLQDVPSGPYLLVLTDDNGCQLMQQLDICIDGIECYQAVTVITPNGDGKNDRFTINCIHDLPNTLSVYNRYGGLEFEMQNYNNSWEGTDQDGNVLSDGGYHWVLQVFLPGGDVQVHKGTVSLVLSLD